MTTVANSAPTSLVATDKEYGRLLVCRFAQMVGLAGGGLCQLGSGGWRTGWELLGQKSKDSWAHPPVEIIVPVLLCFIPVMASTPPAATACSLLPAPSHGVKALRSTSGAAAGGAPAAGGAAAQPGAAVPGDPSPQYPPVLKPFMIFALLGFVATFRQKRKCWRWPRSVTAAARRTV